MMKTLLIISSLPLLVVIMFGVLSVMSRQAPALGLQAGKLAPCYPAPNCVCSEYGDGQRDPHWIEALDASGLTEAQAWAGALHAVVATGGRVIKEEGGYLHAEYTTSLWRFVDDVELRFDASRKLLQVRSASRVGHSDLGANRKRVAVLRTAFQAYQQTLNTEGD